MESSLKMFTWDGEIGNVAVDLHWGRCGRELNDIIFTGDGVVGYVSVDLFLGCCGRVWVDISLLGTVW